MKNQGKGYLPFIVQKCMMFLKDHLRVEGIFRAAGSVEEVQALRKAFDQGENVVVAQYTRDPHTVASLLKNYLSSLPESLIPALLSDRFLAAQEANEGKGDMAAMRAVCDQLPEYSGALLECLLRFLREVVARAEANKMTVENLAVVFGPTLIRRPITAASDYVGVMKAAQLMNSVVGTLLGNVEALFGIRRIDDFGAEFKRIKELGAGAYGSVWLVEQHVSKQQFAAKTIKKTSLEPAALQRLNIEVDLMKRIRHPSVVALKVVCETPAELILVMELAEGGDLFNRLKSSQSFTEDDVALILTQLLRALEYLHALRIVHRDLKPENILLKRKDGLKIKIADFGLSKLLNEMSRLESVCGTPLYVAPEVLAADPHYGPEVDMWSTGIIAYVLLSGGDSPFIFNNLRELFDKIQRGDLRYNEDKWRNISPSARDLVNRCLVPDPAQRLSASAALKHRFFTMRGPSPSVITWLHNSGNDKASNSHELLPEVDERPRSASDPQALSAGHRWVRTQYNRATWCDHCNKFIWGVVLQGLQCSACKLNVHRRCKKRVTVPCRDN